MPRPKTYTPATEPSPYGEKGYFAMLYGARLLVEGSNNPSGWRIGGWTKDGEGRKVDGGLIEAGLYAFAFGLCTVIDNHGGTGAEIDRARRKGLLIEARPGDKLKLPGGVYRIVLCPRRYVLLSPLA